MLTCFTCLATVSFHHHRFPGAAVESSVCAPASILGSAPVAEYRAYLLDSDGHFDEAVPLICADDAEAIEKAKQLADRCDVELWQLTER
jgi:hypothetical protein